MSLRRLIPFLALANALSVPPTAAQEAATVAVTGNVVDEATGEPVSDVIVVVEALGLNLLTDAGGQFVIADVPRGLYILQLFHQDYERLDGDLRIDRPGEFFLSMKPIQYPEDSMITGVVGVVTDNVSGDRIPEVVVNVPGVGRVTTTDADGRFSLSELVPGRHEVAFSHLGYQPRSTMIEVEIGHATKVHVALTVEAIALDPIEVTVERRDRNLESVGFYQREEDGWGDFIDRDDLERWNPSRMTDALMRLPGVRTVMDPQMPSRHFLTFGGDCFPAVYLDGVMIGNGRGPAEMNDILNPMVVAGIEVYRRIGGTPPQYSGTGSSCGVVLIWLRRGG